MVTKKNFYLFLLALININYLLPSCISTCNPNSCNSVIFNSNPLVFQPEGDGVILSSAGLINYSSDAIRVAASFVNTINIYNVKGNPQLGNPNFPFTGNGGPNTPDTEATIALNAVQTAVWSPSSCIAALNTINATTKRVNIFQYPPSTTPSKFYDFTVDPTGTNFFATSMDFSCPDNFLAVGAGIATIPAEAKILVFNPNNPSPNPVGIFTTANGLIADDTYSIGWLPKTDFVTNKRLLAVQGSGDNLQILEFDPSNNEPTTSLTLIFTQNISRTFVYARPVAVSDNVFDLATVASAGVQLYRYNRNTNSLAPIGPELPVGFVAWAPNGQYFSIATLEGGNPSNVHIYSYDGTLISLLSSTSLDNKRVNDIKWAPDCQSIGISFTRTDIDQNGIAIALFNTQVANLSIAKSSVPTIVASGGIITYTITVANTGEPAINATVTDNIPAGTTLISSTAPIGWEPANTVTNTYTNPSFTGTATFTFTVAVGLDTSGIITNSATVTADNQTTPVTPATATTTVLRVINCPLII